MLVRFVVRGAAFEDSIVKWVEGSDQLHIDAIQHTLR